MYIVKKLKKITCNKTSIVFLDQGLVSLSNFVIGIIIARNLGIKEFGFYSMLWMALIFINNIQSALIISPMMSIGPKKNGEDSILYYSAILIQQIIFVLCTCILISGTLLFLYFFTSFVTLNLLVSCIIITASYLFWDFYRKYFFSKDKPGISLIMDIISYLSQILILIIFTFKFNLSIKFIFYVLSFPMIISIIIGMKKFEVIKFNKKSIKLNTYRNFLFSKWYLISSVFQYTGTQGIIFISGIMLNPISVASIRVNQNMVAPLNTFIQAFQNYLPVKASIEYEKKGSKGLINFLMNIALKICFIFLLITIFIFHFGEDLISLVYGRKYTQFSYLLPYFLIYIIIGAIIIIISTFFRTLEYTKPLASASLIGSLLSIGLSVFLIIQFNVVGVVICLVLYNLVIMLILLRKMMLLKNTDKVHMSKPED